MGVITAPANDLPPADDLAPGPINYIGLNLQTTLTGTLQTAPRLVGTLTTRDLAAGTVTLTARNIGHLTTADQKAGALLITDTLAD